MTTIRAGDVVLVDFPFTDQSGSKSRPAVVVFAQQQDTVVVAVTSNLQQRAASDYYLKEWKEAGLLAPSLVRTGKLFTIHVMKIQRVVGHLTEADWVRVKETLRALFD